MENLFGYRKVIITVLGMVFTILAIFIPTIAPQLNDIADTIITAVPAILTIIYVIANLISKKIVPPVPTETETTTGTTIVEVK